MRGIAVLGCPPDKLRAPIVSAHEMRAALVLDRVQRPALVIDDQQVDALGVDAEVVDVLTGAPRFFKARVCPTLPASAERRGGGRSTPLEREGRARVGVGPEPSHRTDGKLTAALIPLRQPPT